MRHTLRLEGIRPEPLASYLKGVAILRIVGEQVDRDATGAWDGEAFVLSSTLDADGLVRFLLTEWAPTPLVAPWNGGSGFNPKDQRSGIEAIAATTDVRFAAYRDAIRAGREVLDATPTEDKAALLAALRSRLPDDGIRWLDAAIVLTTSRPTYPPLLGTGGNDGRFEFSNNQMQRLDELLIAADDPELAAAQLRAALMGVDAPRVRGVSIGQFAPGQAGGANTGMGFTREALINPWDFVLALEGAMTFAASASRALDASGGAAFPFFVRSSASGYASASGDEQSRGELWMPLWSGAATAAEIAILIGEGRAWVDRRAAHTATDFGRAIRQLGIARGIESFQRFVLAQRNGLAFFATSAGRYRVASTPAPDPLTALDHWLGVLNRTVQRDETCPASVRIAARRVDDALLDPNDYPERDARLLLALGALAGATTRSRAHRSLEYLRPMPSMAPGSWPALAHSADSVWRLAFLLADGGLRYELQPVIERGRMLWEESRSRESELAPDVPIIERMLRVGHRRLLSETPFYAANVRGAATLHDLATLANGTLDFAALGRAIDATILTRDVAGAVTSDGDRTVALSLGATLCAAALHGPPDASEEWPIPTAMLHALAVGQGERAVMLARRHLQSRDVPTELPIVAIAAAETRRLGVALLLPLSFATRRALWRTVAPTSAHTSS